MEAHHLEALAALPAAATCRRIDFDKAEVVPGIVPNTWFLVVTGMKPWATMTVTLSPLVYIRQPEYWGIEVIGCQAGIGLPAETPYSAALDISHVIGTIGVEVKGATKSKQIKVR